MGDNFHFFYSIKPIYIHQKFLGLIPFSIDLNNAQNVTRKSRWNIFYTWLVVIFTSCVTITKLTLDYGKQGNFLFKISEFLTRLLIFLAACATLIINIIRGQEVFNQVIKKIIFVDKQIWHHDLPAIYRRSRSLLIKLMLLYIPFEFSFITVDLIWKEQRFTEFMFLLDLINTSIVIQIVLVSCLLIQRFNRIDKLLEEYFPEMDEKKFFFQKQLCTENLTKNG